MHIFMAPKNDITGLSEGLFPVLSVDYHLPYTEGNRATTLLTSEILQQLTDWHLKHRGTLGISVTISALEKKSRLKPQVPLFVRPQDTKGKLKGKNKGL